MMDRLEDAFAWCSAHLFEPVLWPVFLGLVAAHCLAEFLTQSPAASERRALHGTGSLRHGLSVFAWILAVAWIAMPSKQGLATAALATVAHGLVDAARAELFAKRPALRPAGWCFELVLHGATLWLAAAFYAASEGSPTRPLWFTPEQCNAAYLALALVATAANGVAALVAHLLQSFEMSPVRDPLLLDPPPDSPKEMGRLIGILERWLVLLFIAVGQWGAAGLVLAAKSIARFRQLEERRFAEYYLVGSLTSLLAAVLLGLCLAQVGEFGAALGLRVGASE